MYQKISKRKGITLVHVHRSSDMSHQHECHDLIAVWMLRILIDMNTWRSSGVENDDNNLKAIGLSEGICEDLNKKSLFKLLKKTKKKLDQKPIQISSATQKNLGWLQTLVGLTDVELEILLFSICISTYSPLDFIANDIGNLTRSGAIKALATILHIPHADIHDALSRKGSLLNSGLLKIKKDSNTDLESLLEIPDGISEILSVDENERQNLLNQFFHQSKNPSLKLKDYPHIKKEITLIKQYLATVIEKNMSGVNILLYGVPGTGKTELVGALAKSLNTALYQISIADSDGDDLPSSGRISAYQMAQRVLAKQGNSLLLFDEIEDVFPAHSFFDRQPKLGKAWFNNLLETNSIPTFWLSNSIEQIDNAYIRRFDYVLELKSPPKSVRKNILTKNLGDLDISAEWIEQMSKDKKLVPGIISRAAKVVANLPASSDASVEDSMEHILTNTLRAMGNRVEKIDPKKSAIDYQLDALNPSHDINQIVEGFKSVQGARLCLYGPPGTGKTAFGHYISTTLDKPLMVKRASDILSPYVGVAEKNIANIFEEARDEGAVLLLDEADSFLQDRTTLKQSWEVTQVNELLTQMESFDGFFVCSTNLMDKLDLAVLRRFDFKIKLDYLKIEQAWSLFCNAMQWSKNQAKSKIKWRSELSIFRNLTPGDFANVLRQHRLMTKSLAPEELLSSLTQESLFKKDGNQQREIGFHATHLTRFS
ncbi:MAG: AAA family ATPase [Methylophaga sp.]|nr:AAA family ATPase [Methylophaga sp.]